MGSCYMQEYVLGFMYIMKKSVKVGKGKWRKRRDCVKPLLPPACPQALSLALPSLSLALFRTIVVTHKPWISL